MGMGFSCTYGHTEGCLGMQTSIQQTDLDPLESSSLQYSHHTVLCTNIRLDGSDIYQFHQNQQEIKKDILVT